MHTPVTVLSLCKVKVTSVSCIHTLELLDKRHHDRPSDTLECPPVPDECQAWGHNAQGSRSSQWSSTMAHGRPAGKRPTRSLQKGVGTMPGRLGRFVFLGEARDCVEGRDRREGRGVTLAGRVSDRPQSRTAPWGRSGSGFERLESVARAGRGEGPQRGLRRPQDQTRARSLGYRGTQGLRCGSRAPPRPCSRPNPAHVLRRQAPPGETPDSGPQTSPSHTAPPRSMWAGEGRKDWT